MTVRQEDTGKYEIQRVTTIRHAASKRATGASSWLARVLCGLCLLLAGLGVLFAGLNSHSDVHVFDYWAETTVSALAFSLVGAVIVAHRSRHLIGWIFCAIGLVGAARSFGAGYAGFALLATPGSLPGGEVAAWLVSWIWIPHHGLFVFLFLLFPDGRLPAPHWRWPARLSAVVLAVGAISVAFSPGPVDGLNPIENPLGIEGMMNVYGLVKAVSFALGFGAIVSLFGRLHSARGTKRQQLKWCAYFTGVLVSGATLVYTVAETLGVSWLWWPGFMLVMVGAWGLPIAVAIAILRHNLFDIDLIIDLTLVYGLLTAMLAGTVEGVLAVLDHLILFRIGQESEMAIFISALAISVLFAPLRHRIEGILSRIVRRPENVYRADIGFSTGRALEEATPDTLADEESAGVGSEFVLVGKRAG